MGSYQSVILFPFCSKGTVNVVAVDWGEGAHALYDKSAANTRVVAAVVTLFLRRLFEDGFIGPESVHLIGYSLGAHIAGYVGQSVPGIGRITGKFSFGVRKLGRCIMIRCH